eukprot:6162073-Prymnesium_polylepis.3
MDAVQGARGIRGPLIIQRKDDPVKAQFKYDEDLVVFMSDEWRGACRGLQTASEPARFQRIDPVADTHAGAGAPVLTHVGVPHRSGRAIRVPQARGRHPRQRRVR